MARRKITTIRLDPEDERALARAKVDGVAAAELIRRGLRVVGSQYYREGKPAALAGADPDTEALRAWHREREAFQRLSARTLATHYGRWVAVLGGRIVATDADLEVVARRARGIARGRPFFAGHVGAEPEIVEMSGFEVA